jgi:hypothetical protein
MLVKCAYCGKLKPEEEVAKVGVEVNPETGMNDEEEDVCYDCLPEDEIPNPELDVWGNIRERNYEE